MLIVKIDGVAGLKTRLSHYQDAAEPALRRAGDEIFERIFRAADQHTKTGALARSIKNSFRGGEYRIWHDTQHAPHAAFVHWGSKKHVIKPKPISGSRGYWRATNGDEFGVFRRFVHKTKGTLRFPVGGKFVFAQQVKHPGYAGDPYFVTEGSCDKIFDAFSRAFAQEIK